MTAELTLPFTYDDAEQRIVVEQRWREIQTLLRRSLTDLIEAGGKLAEVRDRLRHNQRGGFTGWLDAQQLGRRTAYRLLDLHAAFANRANMAQLDIAATAAYLLAAPGVPEPARQAALDRAAAGEHIGVQAAQELVAEQQSKPTAAPWAPVWQLEAGVRAWLAAEGAADPVARLTQVRDRTTAGLMALDNLLASDHLPAPRRRGDVLQAVHNVLDQLRHEAPGATAVGDGGAGAPTAGAPAAGVPDAPAVAAPDAFSPANGRVTVRAVEVIHADSQDLPVHVAPASVHLVITSPPYNVGIPYGVHDDNLPAAAYQALLTRVFGACHTALVPGGRIAVVVPFGVGRRPWQPHAARVADLLTTVGFTLRGQIVWAKGSSGSRTTWGSWESSANPALRDTTEAIVVAHKDRADLAPPAPLPPDWLPGELFMALTQDLWSVAPAAATRVGHPAPFPVELAERLLRLYGFPGCHVLDPFGGAGATGLAAAALGCRATLLDLDADYCRLAVRRLTAHAEE